MTDAWKQLDDLTKRFTKDWNAPAHPELRVRALGLERKVELGTRDADHMGFTTTQHNVKTMRSLAKALDEACDFVEQSNPVWANLESGE